MFLEIYKGKFADDALHMGVTEVHAGGAVFLVKSAADVGERKPYIIPLNVTGAEGVNTSLEARVYNSPEFADGAEVTFGSDLTGLKFEDGYFVEMQPAGEIRLGRDKGWTDDRGSRVVGFESENRAYSFTRKYKNNYVVAARVTCERDDLIVRGRVSIYLSGNIRVVDELSGIHDCLGPKVRVSHRQALSPHERLVGSVENFLLENGARFYPNIGMGITESNGVVTRIRGARIYPPGTLVPG